MPDYAETPLTRHWEPQHKTSVTGCSFQGLCYIFTVSEREPFPARSIEAMSLKSTAEAVTVDTSNIRVTGEIPGTPDGGVPIWLTAARVHGAAMYVVFTSNKGKVGWVRSFDGTKWTTPAYLNVSGIDGFRPIALVSVHARLWLFAVRTDGRIQTYWTTDGGTWADGPQLQWSNIEHLSACTYFDARGETHLLLAATTTAWNVWTAHYHCPVDGRLVFEREEEHTDLRGHSAYVAVAAGSARNGAKGRIVQMLANGWRGSDWTGYRNQKKKEYDVDAAAWGAFKELTDGYARFPLWTPYDLFTHTRAVSATEVRQELWYIFNYSNAGQSWRYVARWDSDYLMSTAAPVEQQVSKAFRSIIAVIEGPPPYVLNGGDLSKPVSLAEFGIASSEEFTFSVAVKSSVHVTFGGTVKNTKLGASFQLGTELATRNETAVEVERIYKKSIQPVAGWNRAVVISLRPKFSRHEFELCDWSGAPVPGCKAYLFTVLKEGGIDLDEETELSTFPGKPDTHDVKTWLKRFSLTPPEFEPLIEHSLDWTPSGKSEFSFSKKTTKLESKEETVTAELTAGADEIFRIGNNTSFSYQTDRKVTEGRQVSVTLDYPPPRAGHPGDVTKLTLRMFVWRPRAGQEAKAYWIPAGQPGQRPWVVAWSVEKIETSTDDAMT